MTNQQSAEATRQLSGPSVKNPIEHVKMQIVERQFADVWKTGSMVLTYQKISNWELF